MAEYLMMLQEGEKARLDRQCRRLTTTRELANLLMKSGLRRRRNEMDEQRAPNLEELDEQEAHRFLTELLSNLGPEAEYELRHQDYVMEMPQSGERFRGRENMRAFQEARRALRQSGDLGYPTSPPSIQVRRVLVKEGLWVVEGVIDYGDGRVFDIVVISELKDGKMWRDRWYFAEPFEAPEWRSQWVERMDV